MRKALFIATLVVMAPFLGLFASEAQAGGGDIVLSHSKLESTGSCAVGDRSGIFPDAYGPSSVIDLFACAIPCGGDLDCWKAGSFFAEYIVDADGSYCLRVDGIRKAIAYTKIDNGPWQRMIWSAANVSYVCNNLYADERQRWQVMHCYDCAPGSGDGAVSGLDMMHILSKFGTYKSGGGWDEKADLTDDDAVSGLDFFAVLGQFGLVCSNW